MHVYNACMSAFNLYSCRQCSRVIILLPTQRRVISATSPSQTPTQVRITSLLLWTSCTNQFALHHYFYGPPVQTNSHYIITSMDFLYKPIRITSSIGCMGDTQFHFRIRCSGPGMGGMGMRHTEDHCGAPLVLMVRIP